MGLIQSLRRGAGRAAFEADRLMRGNRVRSEIATLDARIEHEQRQMGARLVDLYEAGLLEIPEFEPACRRVQQLRREVQEKVLDLTAIQEEALPTETRGPKSLR